LAEAIGELATATENLQRALERYEEFGDSYWADRARERLQQIAAK
jgi:hypothetical protein